MKITVGEMPQRTQENGNLEARTLVFDAIIAIPPANVDLSVREPSIGCRVHTHKPRIHKTKYSGQRSRI